MLVAAGARAPDMTAKIPHCKAHPDFYDCKLIAAHPMSTNIGLGGLDPRHADQAAVVSAAPAVGYAFGKAGLSKVTVPLQLRAENDQILPDPLYAPRPCGQPA